jgi:hypothetical protein
MRTALLFERSDAPLERIEARRPLSAIAHGEVDEPIEAIDHLTLSFDEGVLSFHEGVLSFHERLLTLLQVLEPLMHELEELGRGLQRLLDAAQALIRLAHRAARSLLLRSHSGTG